MNEFLQFAFPIAIFAGIAFVVLTVQASQNSRASLAFHHIAEKYAGSYTSAGFFQRPSAYWTHRGFAAWVDIHVTGAKHKTFYTQFHIDWPDRGFRCEIYATGFWTQIGQFLGMQDIEIGSPEFDRRYVIHSNDSTDIRELLTPIVQIQIDQLYRSAHFDDLNMSIQGGTLTVRKRGYMRDRSTLESYVERCLELFDMIYIGADGIEFLDERQAVANRETICQVCGESITSETVTCRSCKTPHHRDCWLYFGACSTYGCGETRFVQSTAR